MSLLDEVLADVEQGSDMWKKIRLGKLTSSRANEWVCKTGELTVGAISYIAEKAAEILTGESQENDYESEDMIWGKEQESHARKLFVDKTGMTVTVPGFMLHNEWYGGSLDGLADNTGIIEIKCPKSKKHTRNCLANSQERFKKLCPDYYWQMQSNMLIAKCSYGFFISYDPRVTSAPFYVLLVKRSEKDIKIIEDSVGLVTDELKKLLDRLRTAA